MLGSENCGELLHAVDWSVSSPNPLALRPPFMKEERIKFSDREVIWQYYHQYSIYFTQSTQQPYSVKCSNSCTSQIRHLNPDGFRPDIGRCWNL